MKSILSVCLHSKHILLTLFIITSLLPFKTIYGQDTKDYKFNLGINYDITTDGKTHNIGMWLSDNVYTGMEAKEGGNSAFIIFNMKDKKMITVMESQKMAMIMDINKYPQMAAQQMNDSNKTQPNVQIVKTGVTEKILGYNCTQYKITSEKTESLVWITTELGTGFTNFSNSLMMMFNNGKGKPQGTALPDTKGAENGVTLKLETTDLSTNKVIKLEATAINKDGKEIDITGYNIMSM